MLSLRVALLGMELDSDDMMPWHIGFVYTSGFSKHDFDFIFIFSMIKIFAISAVIGNQS